MRESATAVLASCKMEQNSLRALHDIISSWRSEQGMRVSYRPAVPASSRASTRTTEEDKRGNTTREKRHLALWCLNAFLFALGKQTGIFACKTFHNTLGCSAPIQRCTFVTTLTFCAVLGIRQGFFMHLINSPFCGTYIVPARKKKITQNMSRMNRTTVSVLKASPQLATIWMSSA